MAFTYQVNENVEWDKNDQLISKAIDNTPELFTKEIIPNNIVKVVQDDSYIGGYKSIQSGKNIHKLSEYHLGKGDSLILDLGNHYVGHFKIDIDSIGSPMDAPLHLRVRFAEVPSELQYNPKDYDGWLSSSWIQEEFIHLDKLTEPLEMPRRYSCRYVELTVMDTSPKWKASFSNPVFIATSAVSMKQLDSKRVKEKKLEKIQIVSEKTLQDCMQLVYEDGPKRDRRLWLGDLRLQAAANYKTFKDQKLVKQGLYLFGGMPTKEGKIAANVFTSPEIQPDDTFLFDYSLFFTVTLYDYYQEFKDNDVLDDLYEISKKSIKLALKHVDSNGRFIEDEEWPVFCDWSNEFNKTTAGQAILIYSLKRFISLAETKKDDDIAFFEKALNKLIDFSKEHLFDKENFLFIVESNQETNIASQVWMVLAEVYDKETNKKIMQNAINNFFPITDIATPYMYHHIVEALFMADLEKEAIKLLKGYWGKMIDMGADTFWEAFAPEDPNYSPYGSPMVSSYCHAWSCTPSYLIDKYLIN